MYCVTMAYTDLLKLVSRIRKVKLLEICKRYDIHMNGQLSWIAKVLLLRGKNLKLSVTVHEIPKFLPNQFLKYFRQSASRLS